MLHAHYGTRNKIVSLCCFCFLVSKGKVLQKISSVVDEKKLNHNCSSNFLCNVLLFCVIFFFSFFS